MTKPTVISVGYEGRDLRALLAILNEHDVEVVVDVRLNPVSRKPGFSKSRLQSALQERGIAYQHMPSLGNPKGNRAPFHSDDVATGVAAFAELLASDDAVRDLRELASLWTRHRVAVLCFEQEHERCHRQVVIEAAAARSHRRPAVCLA